MSSISKKLFLALSLACAIGIIVFLIQLIVINSGVEPRQPNSNISGGSSSEQENPGTGSNDRPGDNGEGSDTEGSGSNQPTIRPPPQGQRNEITVDTDSKLVLYTRPELFSLVRNDFDWVFQYTAGGIAGLNISFTFISPQNAATDAEAFLNRHTNGTGADYKGDLYVLDTSVRAYHVTTQDGGVTYEAWLHQMPGSDLALALIINYSNTEQRDALYEILGSISFEAIAN